MQHWNALTSSARLANAVTHHIEPGMKYAQQRFSVVTAAFDVYWPERAPRNSANLRTLLVAMRQAKS